MKGWIFAALFFGICAYLALIVAGLRRRNVGIWWSDYRRHIRAQAKLVRRACPTEVMFCFVDHFEPRWGKADYATEMQQTHIDAFFNKSIISSNTGLTGKELDNFMMNYRPEFEQSKNWNTYDGLKWIRESYKKYSDTAK